jgi:outer membrane protein
MKMKALWFGAGFTLAAAAYIFMASTPSQALGLKIGTASFKVCLEGSKYGKKEQVRFEELKKQLEVSLEAKEKELNELAPKLKDEYIDTLSPEAEAELKGRFKALSQEYSMQQNQYMQMLNQTNYQIIQKFGEWIGVASTQVAKAKNLDLILNEEAIFHSNPTLDVSQDVIQELDKKFQEEEKKEQKIEKETKLPTEDKKGQ